LPDPPWQYWFGFGTVCDVPLIQYSSLSVVMLPHFARKWTR
jgi:hypothetical protein